MTNNLSTAALDQQPNLPHGSPARRYVADEIREVRRIILQAQVEALAKQEGSNTEDHARPGHRALFDQRELEEKLAWAKGLSSDAGTVIKNSFKHLQKLGTYRRVAQAPDPAVLAALERDFPNFSVVTETIRRRLCLCRIAPEQLLKLPPILLDGPPGIGKTAYCQRLARLMGVRFEQIDISSSGVNFSMTGLDAGYATGRPGRIWESLSHESMSVLWLLDEIDKNGSSTKDSSISYLLGLLEPASARRFIDSATQLPIDASWICYIATCNDKAKLDAPLFSRFEVFEVTTPDASQMRAVVTSIHADIFSTEDWAGAFESEVSEDIIAALTSSSPRDIRRRLIEGYANAAEKQRRKLLISDLSAARRVTDTDGRKIGFV